MQPEATLEVVQRCVMDRLKSPDPKFGYYALWDYDIFESLQPPNPPPNAGAYGKPYEAADLNFTLKAGGKGVDAGVKIPNVNDGFAGRAPDLGAYEVGQAPVVYGPRGRTGTRAFYW